MKQITMEDMITLQKRHNVLVENALAANNNDINKLFSDPGLAGALHPALRPNNVHPGLKTLFQIPEMARGLFRDMPEPLDEYRDILDKAPIDNVDFLTGNDGFPLIDTQYESVSGVIHGYGGSYRLTMPEIKWSRIGLAADKMRQLTYLMRKFYEKLVLTQIRDNSGSTFTVAKAWTDFTDGDPFSDIEKAMGIVKEKSGIPPNILIMNRNVYNTVITKRKEYREYQLNGITRTIMDGDFEVTNTPNGLGLVIFDAGLNSYIQDDKVYVCRSGLMGVNHIAIPFFSLDREDPNNPLQRIFRAGEWATPSTDKRDGLAICEIDITP